MSVYQDKYRYHICFLFSLLIFSTLSFGYPISHGIFNTVRIKKGFEIAVEAKVSSNFADHINGSMSLIGALTTLREYNDDYLERMRKGRQVGKSPSIIELDKKQLLKAEGLKLEHHILRNALTFTTHSSEEIVLGVMAPSGSKAIACLQKWVSSLDLPRGVIYTYDEDGNSIDSHHLLEKPVYVKYNSSENGDCCMKSYTGDFSGVIFQPKLPDGEFRQYGDFSLQLFL